MPLDKCKHSKSSFDAVKLSYDKSLFYTFFLQMKRNDICPVSYMYLPMLIIIENMKTYYVICGSDIDFVSGRNALSSVPI